MGDFAQHQFFSEINSSLETKINSFLERIWKEWGLEEIDPDFVNFVFVSCRTSLLFDQYFI